MIIANVQKNLAKDRIAVLPPLAAANAFVRRVRRAGTLARVGMLQWPARIPTKVYLPMHGESGSPSNT